MRRRRQHSHQGAMRIVAFITQTPVIHQILAHLRPAPLRPLPVACAAPSHRSVGSAPAGIIPR